MHGAILILLSSFQTAHIVGSSVDIGFFWQLNDLHVNLSYARVPSPQKHACRGRFGDYQCDSPLALALSAIGATRDILDREYGQKPDFIIWAGDNGPHLYDLPLTELKRGIQLIGAELRNVFPANEVYVLPVVGNHDVVPANEMSPSSTNTERQTWCHQLASDPELWGPWIHLAQSSSSVSPQPHLPTSSNTAGDITDVPPPFANFSTGCFFSHIIRLPTGTTLLLVSLNGLIWYQGNPLSVDAGSDPLDQLKWLDASFGWARRFGAKVLVVSHFPPGASENAPQLFHFLRAPINTRLVSLLMHNSDILLAGLFAHTHVDSFRVMFDHTHRPMASLFTSPSVSPLRINGLGSFNPRIRLYRYNRSSGTVLSYRQYFLNLTELKHLSTSNEPKWKLEYDTALAYGLRDLTAQSLSGLLDEFQLDDTIDGKWSHYWSHELGGRPHDYKPELLTPEGLCPQAKSRCRCEHLCAMRNVELTDLESCLSNCPTALSPEANANTTDSNQVPGTASDETRRLPIIIGVIVTFLVILVGVALIVNREICRNRGRYGRRLMGERDSAPNILFTNLNGSLPHNGGFGGHPPIAGLDQFSDIESSCAELRTTFHPKHTAEDEKSLGTTHTSDESSSVIEPPGVLPPGSAGATPLKVLKSTGYADNHHPLSHNLRRNGVISPLTGTPRRAIPVLAPHFSPDFLTQSNYPTPRSSIATREGDSSRRPPETSSFMCPTEDYYADDEAVADEEDGQELVNHDYSDDDAPFDDYNQSFHLDQGHVPLTQTRPTNREWKFMKRRCKGGSMQSVDEMLPNSSAANVSATGGRRSVPAAISHSHSATLGLRPGPTSIAPNSYSAALASSPSHKAPSDFSSALPSLRNGTTIEESTNINGHPFAYGAVGYDYVRI